MLQGRDLYILLIFFGIVIAGIIVGSLFIPKEKIELGDNIRDVTLDEDSALIKLRDQVSEIEQVTFEIEDQDGETFTISKEYAQNLLYEIDLEELGLKEIKKVNAKLSYKDGTTSHTKEENSNSNTDSNSNNNPQETSNSNENYNQNNGGSQSQNNNDNFLSCEAGEKIVCVGSNECKNYEKLCNDNSNNPCVESGNKADGTPCSIGKCVSGVCESGVTLFETCNNEGGYLCQNDEFCPGNTITSTDPQICCSTSCQKVSHNLCSECGTGLLNICDQEECEAIAQGCVWENNLCEVEEDEVIPVCGNGIVETGEECDDFNTINLDGCSSTCQTEQPPPQPSTCGNGVTESGESCDDGNLKNNDGCSSKCTIPSSNILWMGDHEENNIEEWFYPGTTHGGSALGGDFNSGTWDLTTTTEVAHSGNYSARMEIDAPPQSGVRLFRWGESQQYNELYYSAWYYFPYNYNLYSGWWNVMQWKSKYNNGANVEPYMVLNVDGNGADDMFFYVYDSAAQNGYDQIISPRKPIPVGQWVHVEAYHKCAGDNSGHLIFWQDGVKIIEITNVATRHPSGDCQWSINDYTAGATPNPTVLFVDDIAISTQRIGYPPSI